MHLLTKPFVISGILIFLFISGISYYFLTENNCSPIPQEEPEAGSQGFRIWSGPTLQSFTHADKKICVPEGWHAVGEISSGARWAKYEKGMTGVVISNSAFASTTLEFAHSAYVVTVYYPGTERTALTDRYIASITNAFERVGENFGDTYKNQKRAHAVLITAGIEGTTSEEGVITVYPDPGPNVTIFVQNVDGRRGEELFIHGVTHLYNRFRNELGDYQKKQTPIPPEDWQELEAVWGESAYRSSYDGRIQRLQYLYNVHTAVQTNDFSLIVSPPFNNREAFESIRPSVVLPKDATYLDAQYGHYVLGPLVMVAVDGILRKNGTNTSVEKLLLDLHTGKTGNFFDELEKILPLHEVDAIRNWMFEGETIPRELIFTP